MVMCCYVEPSHDLSVADVRTCDANPPSRSSEARFPDAVISSVASQSKIAGHPGSGTYESLVNSHSPQVDRREVLGRKCTLICAIELAQANARVCLMHQKSDGAKYWTLMPDAQVLKLRITGCFSGQSYGIAVTLLNLKRYRNKEELT